MPRFGAFPADHAARHESSDADVVNVAGLVGLLADDQHVLDTEVLLVAAALAHKTRHQNGGADKINVGGLSGELADNQPPKAHTLASHSTKTHGELSDAPENAHHTKFTNTEHDITARHSLGTVVPHDALASLTEKAHDSLTGVSADQHHAQSHTLASHSTKAHSELTGVTADLHHAQSHNLSTHPGSLDNISDGATYGKVLLADLYSGHVKKLQSDGSVELLPDASGDIVCALAASKGMRPSVNAQGCSGLATRRWSVVYTVVANVSSQVTTPKVYSGGDLILDSATAYVLPPTHNSDDFGRPDRKWSRVCRTNVDGCPIPTSNSAIDVFKKIKAPQISEGDHGSRHYFNDEDFPEEMKYKNREGDIVIEQVRTLGVTVQAVRELVERVEALEAK